MSTPLTVNGSAGAATTLAAAGKMFNTTGGTTGNTSTKVGSSTLYKQIFALGTATNQTGVASIPAPTDANWHGWMWDVTTLEGQRIAAGTWTPTIHLLASTGTTVTPTVEWYKRSSAGVYTQIGTKAGSSIALTTSAQLLVFTAPSLSLMDFATGDKLMMWLWVNQSAGGATNSTISVVEAISGSTSGTASEAQAVTPGYAPTPVALSVTIPGVGTIAGTMSVNLPGTSTIQTWPTAVVASDGVACVIWHDGTNLVFAASVSPYSTWSAKATISATDASVRNSAACIDGSDNIYVGYASTTSTHPGFRKLTRSGNTWTVGSEVIISTTGTDSTTPGMKMLREAGGRLWFVFGYGGVSPVAAYYSDSPYTTWTLGYTGGQDDAGFPSEMAGFAGTSSIYLMAFSSAGSNSELHYSRHLLSNTPTTWDADSATSGTYALSSSNTGGYGAGVDASGRMLAVFSGGSYGVEYATYVSSTNTWDTNATALGANASDSYVTIAGNATDLWAFWSSYVAANNYALVYKKWSNGGSAWDGSATTLVASGSNIVHSSAAYGNSSIGIAYVTGTASPYTVNFTTIAASAGVALSVTIAGVGTLAATFSLALAPVTMVGVGVLTPALTASQALPATTIAGVGTLTMAPPSLGTALSKTIPGVGTLSATFSLALAPITMAGIGTISAAMSIALAPVTMTGAGTLTATLTESTALTSTIAGVGTLIATLSTTGGVSLAVTIAGVGTLTETFSLATALISTIAGVGTLTPTLSAHLTLASLTIPGVGTLTGTFTESTVLTTTIAGIGTLSGTMTEATALTSTISGIGTLSATMTTTGGVSLTVTMAGAGVFTPAPFTEKTALTVTVPGVGQLAPTLSAKITMPSTTIAGVGTLAAALSAQTALAVSLSGTGTLSGIFSVRVALSLTMMGTGTLSGVLGIPVTAYLSAIWLTRDMAVTWGTRDGKITWQTRDEQAAWDTRDEQETWTTRDEQTTWKTRS